MRTDMHNAVVNELSYILNYAGFMTKKEERRLFTHGLNQEPLDAEMSEKRPDISILNWGALYNAPKLLLDVTIPATLHYTRGDLANIPATHAVGHWASIANNDKIEKYGAVSTANGFSFKAIVFESNGYVHPDTVLFLKEVAKMGAPIRGIPAANLYKYFIRLLSVRLQLELSVCISKKTQLAIQRGNHNVQHLDANAAYRNNQPEH
jgi:hypothetical protein